MPASQEASKLDSFTFAINERTVRKNTYSFTDEELETLEDLKIELRRKYGLAATMNDLLRCGLHHLLEDHRKNGEGSIAVRRLRAKHLK